MKRRILVMTIVLTSFLGICYGQNNLLTEFNIESNNVLSENDVNVNIAI